MSLYWNDNYNQGTGLYGFGDNTNTGDLYIQDLYVNNQINSTDNILLRIGDLTNITQIGKLTGNTEVRSGLKISSITTDGFLRIDGTVVSSSNQHTNIIIINPNIQSNINMNGFDIFNANIINSNNITDLTNQIANITNGNLGVYILKAGDSNIGNLIIGEQSNPRTITSWGTIKQIDPTNSSQFIELDALNDTLFFSNINAKIKGSGTSLQTENITNFEVIGGSFSVKHNAIPSNFGGYIQINPNFADRTKIFHSGDRGLDIDGQTNNHQLRMTGFGNITMDNQTIFNQSATFKQSQFTEGLITIQPPGSGNIQQLSATGLTYSGSANTRIEGDASTLKAYQIGNQYPFSKVQLFEPLECDTINAVGSVLKIGNDNSTDEIQIGVGANVHIVNILTGGGTEADTLNIGSGNTQINFFGNTFYNYITDHKIADREIILNANSVGSGTSGLCGLWIRDNNYDAYNYFVVNSDRDGFLLRGGADPGFSNSHAVNLKCVNISGSSGKFLTCVDSTNHTNLVSGSIVKADLPASVAFLDNDQTFTGNQTYNCPTLTCNPLTELFINQISSTSSTFNTVFNSNVASASGKKFIQSTAPTSGNDLTNKTYCDNKVLKSGDTMTGSLNINAVNPLIINTDNAILLPRRQTGSNPQFITFQNNDGSASYGVIESAGSAGSSAFGTVGSYDLNIGSYNSGGDLNFFQQGVFGGIKMKIGFGNTRSYNPIDMLNNKITNVGNPTASADAVNKNYVDSLVSANVSALLSSVNTWTANNTFNGSFLRVGTSSKLVVDNVESSNPANLNVQINSNTAFINNRIVQIDPLAETGLVIFGGNLSPAGANPTTISGQNSFSISQVPSGPSNAGVYLQTWNSRVLYLNSLGGNDITCGSQGGGAVNLNCWNNIRAYNKGNGGQYIQTYINTSDSNRGYLESVGTNITISASPSNTYNCIFKNLTLVQIGGLGSTIPLHTYGQITMYDGANTGAYWQFNPTNGLIYNGGQSTTWDGQSQAGVNYNINNYASFNTNTPFVSTSAGNNISLRRNNDSTSPAKMILTNNAGSTTYGVVGIEDSNGGDILSGSTANSLVIGTPSNTNFFFIQDNSRAGVYRSNKWLYNKMDRPHMCWANNPEGNEGGNKLQVRYIKYSGSWPTTPTITSSDNYTQTIALDTLYTIITSSTSYIAMVAGTLNITSSGWYNITITYGQYLQGQIGRNSIYAIAGNSTEEPFYCLAGDILFFEIYDWLANTGTSRTFSFKISQIYGI